MLRIVGDRVSKIEATRDELLERPLKIGTKVNIVDVEKKQLFGAEGSKEGVSFKYVFEVEYGSKPCARILVEGAVFAIGTKKEREEIIDLWRTDKPKAMELSLPFLNRAMELGYLSAIPVAKELRLPTPLKLPRFITKENEESLDEKKSSKKEKKE